MAQVGVHGLIGLVGGEYLASKYLHNVADRRAFLFGFTLGNMAPDLDFLAVVGLYPVDHALAMHLHRGFSHSILAALALLVGFYLVSLLMNDRYVLYLGYGLALGVACHFTVDVFVWFSAVDIFWPASVYGQIPPVNLWGWFHTPLLLGRLLGASELAAYAYYFDCLVRLAVSLGTNREVVPQTRRMATICWILWALLTALAFDVSNPSFELYLYVPMGIVFVPACFYLTWRMQTTIELLAIVRRQL